MKMFTSKKIMRPVLSLFALGGLTWIPIAHSDEQVLEEITIIGNSVELDSVSGSAYVIDEEDLDRFDYVDLRKVLNQAPGVYIREEDGYGLRPNIGIRGAAAERSQKITLMRDEVLITPAPYSAPAAYYVPNVSRVSGIEVVKGPAAVTHGPHTVGGAVNMMSVPVPSEAMGVLDLSYGTDAYYKAQGSYGGTSGNFGFLVDVLSYGADGFKSIDGHGDDTGFERTDFGVKLLYQNPDSARDHRVTLLVEGGEEKADETYLGLTDADFNENPYRRYAASQLARFESEHLNLLFNYSFSLSGNTTSNLKAYFNEFDRSWNKLDGFVSGPTLQKVLQSPNQYRDQYFVLTGLKDSNLVDDETLDVTNNDRSYESSGIQWSVADQRDLGSVSLTSRAGVRFHSDQVERNHQPKTYLMTSQQMVSDNIQRAPKVVNKAQSDAVAVYAIVRATLGSVSLDVGARHEDIEGEVQNYITGETVERSQSLTSPSVSAIWELSDTLSLFGGLYEGFSPAGPGSDASNEESTNYELGVRFSHEATEASLVGFFSDYGNLIGRCRVSDTTCEPGSEFNGGEVEISGVELLLIHAIALSDTLSLEGSLAYTYTESEFATTFLSGFPQWGLVKEGDELPYIPESVGNARLSLVGDRWRVEGSVDFQSQMREVPGVADIEDALHSDGFAVLDLSATYALTENLSLQASLLNVTDEAAVVSHRPFGARPNRPRSVVGRIRYAF
jgi:Fe(3+) dicitrate transport protein